MCSARSRPGTPRGQSQAPPRSREAAPHPSSPHSHIAQTPLCCALSLPKTRRQPAASLRFLPSMAGNKILTAGASLGSSMHTAPCGHLHAFTSSPDPKTDPSRLTPAPPWCVGGCPPKPQPCPTLWAPHTRVRACQAASPGHGEPLCTLAGIDAWQRGESISIIKPCTTGLCPPSPFPMAEGCSSPWQGPTGTTAPGRCQGSSPLGPCSSKGHPGHPCSHGKGIGMENFLGENKAKTDTGGCFPPAGPLLRADAHTAEGRRRIWGGSPNPQLHGSVRRRGAFIHISRKGKKHRGGSQAAWPRSRWGPTPALP